MARGAEQALKRCQGNERFRKRLRGPLRWVANTQPLSEGAGSGGLPPCDHYGKSCVGIGIWE